MARRRRCEDCGEVLDPHDVELYGHDCNADFGYEDEDGGREPSEGERLFQGLSFLEYQERQSLEGVDDDYDFD